MVLARATFTNRNKSWQFCIACACAAVSHSSTRRIHFEAACIGSIPKVPQEHTLFIKLLSATITNHHYIMTFFALRVLRPPFPSRIPRFNPSILQSARTHDSLICSRPEGTEEDKLLLRATRPKLIAVTRIQALLVVRSLQIVLSLTLSPMAHRMGINHPPA